MKVKRFAILILLLLTACSTPPSAGSSGQSLTAGNTTRVEPLPPTATPVPTEPSIEAPAGISWEDAAAHVGAVETVCGPVAGTSYRPDVSGEPTFLNIGQDYPSPSRFTLVIWGEDRGNFPGAPEDTYRGNYVCATGEIEEFRGVTQMELSSPTSLAIQ